MPEKNFIEVFASQNGAEARIIQQMLQSEGINAMLLDEFASGSVAGFGPAIPVRVVVPPEQADAARAMIKETDK